LLRKCWEIDTSRNVQRNPSILTCEGGAMSRGKANLAITYGTKRYC
jgi:hypothetical protein